jgi:hypothetical protein
MQDCPMCRSLFDSRKYKLIECAICNGEGSTACCVAVINGGEPICVNCEDKS